MALKWMLARDASSGSWVARKQIPARLRPAYAAAFGKGWAEKFSRPPPPMRDCARFAAVCAILARSLWCSLSG